MTPLFVSFVALVLQHMAIPERIELEMPSGRIFALTEHQHGDIAVFTHQPSGEMPGLWQMRRAEDGQWQSPVPVPFGDPSGDADAYFQPGTGRLVFMSLRGNESPNWDIWTTEWTGSDWHPPQPVTDINSSGPDIYPTVDIAGNIAFATVREGTGGDRQIWIARALGGGGYDVGPASGQVNRDSRVSNPLLFPDGQRLLVFEMLDDGHGGPDLSQSCLSAEGWSEPVNLGRGINTELPEFAPGLSADGGYVTFTRGEDLYRLPAAALPPC